jgi:signal transduction histidine kinase
MRPTTKRLTPSLLAAATVSVAALALSLVLVAGDDEGAAEVALWVLLVTTPVAAGLYATRTRGTARFGRQLIAIAAIWSLTILAQSDASVPYSIGRVVAWAIFPTLVYLLLAYPRGRLTEPVERVLAGAITALVAVFFAGSALFADAYPEGTPWTDCTDACPANAFMVTGSEPGFVDAFMIPFREVVGAALLVAVAVLLVRRARQGDPLRRVTMLPVLAVGVAAVLTLVVFMAVRATGDDAAAETVGRVWSLFLPALAAAFCVGLVQRRLLVANALATLGAALRASLEPAQIGVALRSTVGSDAVQILVRDRDGRRWVHEDGRPARSEELGRPGYRLRAIGDGRPLAALLVDESLEPDDELIEGIVGLTIVALREARLKEELEVSLHDLDDSRKRIATAADAERRRIERDLHDGAQQRLIALRMRIALAEDMLGADSAAAQTLRELEHDVDLALDEIRSLAHGIYPPLLADRGIADALRSVGRRLPLRVSVRAAGLRRHSPEVESAVYYSCLEALQNVAKHAGATSVTVSLSEVDGIAFEVRDDGAGFDVAAVSPGAGLRNIRDRVESLGGTLRIESSPRGGTTVSGKVPVESGVSREAAPPLRSAPERRAGHAGGRRSGSAGSRGTAAGPPA